MSGDERPVATGMRTVIDLTATALLVLSAAVGFAPGFADTRWVVAVLVALVAGGAIAWAGARWRWGALVVAAVTVLVAAGAGGAAALPETTLVGVIPTGDTFVGLAGGVVFSWKQFLTAYAPMSSAEGMALVPFFSTLLVTVLTATAALRARRAGWALVPAAAFLVFVIAFGTPVVALPVLQGAVFVITATGWLAWRRALSVRAHSLQVATSERGRDVRRVLAGGLVLLVAVGVGAGTSTLAAPQGPRYVLRDVVIPPLDLRQYPSPLQSWRGLIRDHKNDVLVAAAGLPEGSRVRIAAMDAYDGVVFNVAREGAGSSASFTRLGTTVPSTAAGTPAHIRMRMEALQGVWMPGTGAVTGAQFTGDRADELSRTAFYNRSTGVAVVTAGLRTGDEYTIDAIAAPTPDAAALAAAEPAPVSMPQAKDVPEGVAALAADLAAGAESPYEQAAMIASALSEKGFFSHGLEGEPYSRPGHGSQRIGEMLAADQWVGDGEQYAVAMALMAGELGLPARVVMGFAPDETDSGTVELTGDDLRAWVEIPFDGVGWVPFDPTPPEDQVPTDQQTEPQKELQPQSLQPPPPVQENVELPPDVPEDEGDDEKKDDAFGMWWAILGIVAAGLGVLAILLAPFVAIVVYKLARRRRRRSRAGAADRISGAWEEVADTATDLGSPLTPGGTRLEGARELSDAWSGVSATALAERADVRVFGPGEPDQQEVEGVWGDADEVVGQLRGSVGRWRRLRSRVSLRSLRAPAGAALRRWWMQRPRSTGGDSR